MQLRERQRDAARTALAVAQAAERRFDEQRRGWRRLVTAEAEACPDERGAFARWLDGRRANEVQGAEHAQDLARRVRAAEEVQRRCDIALEQVCCISHGLAQRTRRAAAALEQRRLDDVGRGADGLRRRDRCED